MIKALATGIAKGDFSDPAFKVDVQGYQGETGLADRLLYDEHAAFMDFQKVKAQYNSVGVLRGVTTNTPLPAAAAAALLCGVSVGLGVP